MCGLKLIAQIATDTDHEDGVLLMTCVCVKYSF